MTQRPSIQAGRSRAAGRVARTRYLVLAAPYLAVGVVLWLVNLLLPLMSPLLDIPFAREVQEGGTSFYVINRDYLGPFFPAGSPLIPELKSTYVLRTKKPHSFRVVCLGESAMFGVPFQYSATIPALVRKQLRRAFPDLEVEVINLGASAINSNVMREMVSDVLSLEPDLVLVYTGHNEFYGPDGIGMSWLERHFPGLTPWKYRLRRQPLVYGLQRWISGLGKGGGGGEQNLMHQVSAGTEVALGSPEATRVLQRFEENLRSLVGEYRAAGVPVILGELSSNLMFPPFSPRAREGNGSPAQAIAAGRLAEAGSLVARGLGADSTDALFLYWRGRLSLAAGDTVGAVRYLELARDHDRLKFRAPGKINEIIHRVGNEFSIPVVPIDSVLRARSPRGITDSLFFCEHLHMTFAGYDAVARLFVQEILRRNLAPSARQPAAPLIPFHPDSLSVPWLDLGFGALSIRGLTSRWPFPAMPRRRDVVEGAEEWELKILNDLHDGRIGWADACLQYAQSAQSHQKRGAVVTALSALVEEHPWTSLFRYGLATALEEDGRKTEAILQYQATIGLTPDLPRARLDLALLLTNEGRNEEAQEHLRAVLRAPGSDASATNYRAMAYYTLAVIAANRDSITSSLSLLEEALRVAPQYPAALGLRAELLRRRR